MIDILALVLGLGLAQQEPAPPLRTPADTTQHVVVVVAGAVADVRSDLDHYRQAIFNDSNATGILLSRGTALRDACAALSRAAAGGRRLMCRHCLSAALQPSYNNYREYLPSLVRMSDRCVARIEATHIERAKPVQLRQLILVLANDIQAGLIPYEARVGAMLGAMHRSPPGRLAQPPSGRSP